MQPVEEIVEAKKHKAETMEALVAAVQEDRENKVMLYGEDGGGAGVLGGRPEQRIRLDKRGRANDEDSSNRLYPGQDKRRQDITPWEGVAIAKYMEAKRAEHADEDAYWRAVLLRFRPKSKKTLQAIFGKKALYERRIEELSLGKGTGMSKISSTGMSGVMKYAVSHSAGCRAAGAGRKDLFKDYKEQVKHWAIKERQHGHSLNATDLWREYKFILQENIRSFMWLAGKLEEGSTERQEKKVQAGMLQDRIAKVEKSPSYFKQAKGDLVAYCGMRLLKPQRLVNLSPVEEQVRCELTWQMYDERLWQVAFAGIAELQELVLDPVQFSKVRTGTALVFADQVPWRGKIGGGLQLHFKDERPSKKTKLKAQEAKAPIPNEGQSQSRGGECEDADKYRITVELRQVILHYFEEGKDPVGIQGPTAIVVAGKHCRLDNIGEDGKFIRSERFWYEGKETVHTAGQPAGALARSWRTLRQSRPDLFEAVKIYQQPAAVVDSIIQAWMVEELGERYPSSLCQRDMLGSYRCLSSVEAMQVVNMLDSAIAGKMTPVLQMTDTDFARRLKVLGQQAKEEVRQELKLKAIQEKKKETFHCGCREILEIVVRSVKKLEEEAVKGNLVLASARRNFMLSYRPDFKAKRLVRSDTQDWAKGLPEGSHRIKESWAANRYSWLQADAEHRPLPPDWSRSEVAKKMSEQAEHEYQAEEGTRIRVGGVDYQQDWCDLGEWDGHKEDTQDDIAFKQAMEKMKEFQIHPEKRALFRELDKLKVSEQDPEVQLKKLVKKAERKKAIKEQYQLVLKTWKTKSLRSLKKKEVSRRDILSQIRLKAGTEKAQGKVKAKGKAKAAEKKPSVDIAEKTPYSSLPPQICFPLFPPLDYSLRGACWALP